MDFILRASHVTSHNLISFDKATVRYTQKFESSLQPKVWICSSV